jgi:hypothetical protein
MLAVADRQRGFFDAAWSSDLLPEDSSYALLAEHGDRIVRDEDFAECYSERQGRPSIPPSQLAKVLLLAYRDDLPDGQRALHPVRRCPGTEQGVARHRGDSGGDHLSTRGERSLARCPKGAATVEVGRPCDPTTSTALMARVCRRVRAAR